MSAIVICCIVSCICYHRLRLLRHRHMIGIRGFARFAIVDSWNCNYYNNSKHNGKRVSNG